ncbi:MAG: geranylgeranylglyceryl/heptaprenylglyceryl phosphate synthase, partial [Bacteroidia bacterium]
ITSVSYMSNTIPIPATKNSIAATTALAGEMLGMKIIYMDAGSGAKNHAPAAMIKEVRKNVNTPIFLGGGIRDAKSAVELCKAGADVIVVGNAFEKDPSLIKKLTEAVHACR